MVKDRTFIAGKSLYFRKSAEMTTFISSIANFWPMINQKFLKLVNVFLVYFMLKLCVLISEVQVST